jgi:transketolase
LKIGVASELRTGGDATIIACGVMVERAMDAAEELSRQGIEACVVDMHTLKPIDKDAILRAAETGAIVTAEDHSVIGGLGSAVAEILAEECPTRMRMVGVMDKFGESGSPDEIMNKMGLTSDNIVQRVVELVQKPGRT